MPRLQEVMWRLEEWKKIAGHASRLAKTARSIHRRALSQRDASLQNGTDRQTISDLYEQAVAFREFRDCARNRVRRIRRYIIYEEGCS